MKSTPPARLLQQDFVSAVFSLLGSPSLPMTQPARSGGGGGGGGRVEKLTLTSFPTYTNTFLSQLLFFLIKKR